jgi:hypothetical protein
MRTQNSRAWRRYGLVFVQDLPGRRDRINELLAMAFFEETTASESKPSVSSIELTAAQYVII